jgi:hypothetical protein
MHYSDGRCSYKTIDPVALEDLDALISTRLGKTARQLKRDVLDWKRSHPLGVPAGEPNEELNRICSRFERLFSQASATYRRSLRVVAEALASKDLLGWTDHETDVVRAAAEEAAVTLSLNGTSWKKVASAIGKMTNGTPGESHSALQLFACTGEIREAKGFGMTLCVFEEERVVTYKPNSIFPHAVRKMSDYL